MCMAPSRRNSAASTPRHIVALSSLSGTTVRVAVMPLPRISQLNRRLGQNKPCAMHMSQSSVLVSPTSIKRHKQNESTYGYTALLALVCYRARWHLLWTTNRQSVKHTHLRGATLYLWSTFTGLVELLLSVLEIYLHPILVPGYARCICFSCPPGMIKHRSVTTKRQV